MNKAEPLTESYFYILLCLAKEPMHGYRIMQETELLSDGMVKIGSGTMYGATSNMMKKKWIVEKRVNEPGMERKRMYQLTELGQQILKDEAFRLNCLVRASEKILGGNKHEEKKA